MVSGAYSVDQACQRDAPRPKPRAPQRPTESPPQPPPPSQLRMVAGAPVFLPPPSPPPRISSMNFSYLPESSFDDKEGPGRLPIYRAESPSTAESSKSDGAAKCCCVRRHGVSLASALLTAAAAVLALLLLLGVIVYFLLLADTASSEQVRVRQSITGTNETTSTTEKALVTTASSTRERTISYATPPARPDPTNIRNSTPARSTEQATTSPGEHNVTHEPLFKDIVVSYQPFQPPRSQGDVVTAGFVPHWFREELANTGEERASTPNRFTTTSPVHVSPTLPSAVSTGVTTRHHHNNASDASAGALCHSPRLEACRGVLPYDLTTLQTGAIGATNARLEAAAGALGFAHVARGACRLAARQLLCALLEPPCQPDDRVLQPCRAACQAAMSECGEFLLATLGLGAEFDCSRYPDSRDSTVCVDLTGDCDAPSMRCTSSGACVPSQWRCDTRDDCSDSSDERACRTFHAPSTLRPSASSRPSVPCRPGQARCLDGACIEASQLCDGLHHCSRGEDEAVCPPS